MSQSAQAIFESALSLPDDERSTLTFKLLDSLPPPEGLDEVSRDEFLAEIARRHEEAQRKPEECVPADEAHEKLASMLREHHAAAPRWLLDPKCDSAADDELGAELDRRAAEYARDPSVAAPWKEFRWDDRD